jgi:hypothetical protein
MFDDDHRIFASRVFIPSISSTRSRSKGMSTIGLSALMTTSRELVVETRSKQMDLNLLLTRFLTTALPTRLGTEKPNLLVLELFLVAEITK